MWQTETDGGGGCVFLCAMCLLAWTHTHTHTHTVHSTMSVEKRSLRRIMYAAARSPKPRVSVHLVFNCYKLSHLTPSSLPSTTGQEQSPHRGRPDSKLRTNIGFLNQKQDPYWWKECQQHGAQLKGRYHTAMSPKRNSFLFSIKLSLVLDLVLFRIPETLVLSSKPD